MGGCVWVNLDDVPSDYLILDNTYCALLHGSRSSHKNSSKINKYSQGRTSPPWCAQAHVIIYILN